VHGNLYGHAARALEDALATGRDVLLDIATQGARSSGRATRTRC